MTAESTPPSPWVSRWLLLPVGAAFTAVYLLFDLREGGPSQSITTTSLVTPARYAHLFGLRYAVSMIVADAVLGLLAAALVLSAVAAHNRRRRLGSCCSLAAGLGFGFAVFGCPGCLVPLAGTLGLTLFAGTLPLLGVELKLATAAFCVIALLIVHRRRRSA